MHSEKRLLTVGKVVENGKLVELSVHIVLAGFVSTETEMLNALLPRTLDQQIKLLRSLAKTRPLSEGSRSALLEWVAKADKARLARNEVVHTVYALAEDGSEVDLRLSGPSEPATITSMAGLNRALEMINDVFDTAPELTAVLALETCWRGIPPTMQDSPTI